MLDSRAIAVQGVGFEPRTMAVQGLDDLTVVEVPDAVPGGPAGSGVLYRTQSRVVQERRRRLREEDSMLLTLFL